VDVVAAVVQGEQEDGCGGCGEGDGPRGVVVEQGEGRAGEGDGDCDGGKVAERGAREGVGRVSDRDGGAVWMFPCVDEEAVEAAESGEEKCWRE